MEQQRARPSITNLPYFDGENYPDWKSQYGILLEDTRKTSLECY